MRSAAYVSTRPRYGVLDVVGLLLRELLLMIVVFVVILALGVAAAMTLKKSYTATGAVFAGGTLKNHWRADLTQDEAVALALAAILDAADDDAATGGVDLVRGIYPVVAVVDARGFRRVGAEVARLAQAGGEAA